MSAELSSWIPKRRIHVALAVAFVFAVAAVVGRVWSLAFLALLAPALGAGWVAFVMLRTRHQLSPRGGGWEGRIHDLVRARLSLPIDSRAAVLDIGCGDGDLLIRLLRDAPGMTATGVDFWGKNWDYAQSSCEQRLRSHGLRASFECMDAARLDFTDDRFDIVVSVMCFHEVHAPAGAATNGPLLALGEAVRVLSPGGVFVFIDRFGDEADYGHGADLDGALGAADEICRESLVELLHLPWPLRSKRALGPVQIVSGRIASR